MNTVFRNVQCRTKLWGYFNEKRSWKQCIESLSFIASEESTIVVTCVLFAPAFNAIKFNFYTNFQSMDDIADERREIRCIQCYRYQELYCSYLFVCILRTLDALVKTFKYFIWTMIWEHEYKHLKKKRWANELSGNNSFLYEINDIQHFSISISWFPMIK